MPPTTSIDVTALRPVLDSLNLPAHPRPELVWVHDQATAARIKPTNATDWAAWGVATHLLALSYKTPLEDTDAVGVWLPDHQVLHLADTAMNTHILPLTPRSGIVPEHDRVRVAGELRGLIGSALARPGRMAIDDPVVIGAHAASEGFTRAVAARGHKLHPVTPAQAADRWDRACHVFIHADTLDAVVRLRPRPRADVTVLTARRTPDVNRLAALLPTDEVVAWPAATQQLADSIARRRHIQNQIRAGRM